MEISMFLRLCTRAPNTSIVSSAAGADGSFGSIINKWGSVKILTNRAPEGSGNPASERLPDQQKKHPECSGLWAYVKIILRIKIIFRNSDPVFIFDEVLIVRLSRKAEGNGPMKP